MAFSITCTNKGCFDTMEPLLDTTDNKVYCSTCGKELNGITIFAKSQMKSLGQTMKNRKSQKVFSVSCDHCKKITQPKISGNKIICRECGEELKLTPHFAAAVRAVMSSNGD